MPTESDRERWRELIEEPFYPARGEDGEIPPAGDRIAWALEYIAAQLGRIAGAVARRD